MDLGRLTTPTQYWLVVGDGQAIAARPALGVPPGTLLLLETDRKWFPPPNSYDGELCVVEIPGPQADEPARVLAEVHSIGYPAEHPLVLTARPFEPGDEVTEVACDVTVRVFPGGQTEVTGVTHRRTERSRPKGSKAPDAPPRSIPIRREDVLAVWTGLAYQQGQRLRG